MIPLIDLYFTSNDPIQKVLAQLGILISMYGAYLTGSRGATLGVVLAGAVMIWKYRQKYDKARIVRAIAGVVLFCGLAFVLPGNENVLQRFVDQSESSGEIEARTVVIWPLLSEKLLERNPQQWLIGEGMSSSSDLLNTTFGRIGWGDAHNMYLQSLYDQGLIGLALFLFFLYWVMKRIAYAPSAYVGLFYGWFVCLLVEGMFEVEANNKAFWMLLGVMVGSCVLKGKEVHPVVYVRDAFLSKGKLPGVRPAQAG
jgi:O-antigen ligase